MAQRNETVHLQGIGLHHAKPASDLASGDMTVWNYGGRYRVLATMDSVTGLTLTAWLVGEDGRIWTKRFGAYRLVAVEVPR